MRACMCMYVCVNASEHSQLARVFPRNLKVMKNTDGTHTPWLSENQNITNSVSSLSGKIEVGFWVMIFAYTFVVLIVVYDKTCVCCSAYVIIRVCDYTLFRCQKMVC